MMQVQYFSSQDGIVLPAHIFFPQDWKQTDRRSVVILFFGGWWMGGSVKQFYPQAQELARLGMVCVLPQYRTFGQNGTPVETALYDAGASVQFVLDNTSRLGIDPHQVILGGASAGGHLAISLLFLEQFHPKQLNPSSVSAVILWNPVLDVVKIQNPNNALRTSAFSKEELSPFHHVKPNMPDLLLFQGIADTTVSVDTAKQFAQFYQDQGNHCELNLYPGREHGFFNLSADSIEDYYDVLGKIIRFVYERHCFPL